MHPGATTVLEFYFLEQAIPDMQRESPAYLEAAEGVSPNIQVLEWWKNYNIGQRSLPASPASSAAVEGVFSVLIEEFIW